MTAQGPVPDNPPEDSRITTTAVLIVVVEAVVICGLVAFGWYFS